MNKLKSGPVPSVNAYLSRFYIIWIITGKEIFVQIIMEIAKSLSTKWLAQYTTNGWAYHIVDRP